MISVFTFSKGLSQTDIISELSIKGDSCIDQADYFNALIFYKEAKNKADKYKDSTLIYEQLFKIGELYYQKGVFDSAQYFYCKIIKDLHAEAYPSNVAEAKKSLAHVQWRAGDNVEALQNVLKSIEIFNSLQDTASSIHANTILAGIYISLGKLEESKLLYDELLTIAERANDTVGITTSFEHLGIIAYFEGEFERAIDLYNKAYQLNQRQKNVVESALNLANMGESYLELKQYEKALSHLNEAYQMLDEYQFNSGIIFIYYTLGRVFHGQGKYEEALEYYSKSLELMEKTGEVREKNYIFQLMSSSLEANGNDQKALHYYKLYAQEKDSIFNVDKAKQLEEVRAKYQLEEKENQNYILNLQNRKAQEELEARNRLLSYQYIITGIILISLLIVIIQFYYLQKRRRSLENANNTKNRLFNIIAHDIKNPVGNISSLVSILEKSNDENEKKNIYEMLAQSSGALSVLVNNILSWSNSNRDGFQFKFKKLNIFEISQQVLNLFVYQIAQKNITVENKVPIDFEFVSDEDAISTIIRNLMSNAIKYTNDGGRILISVLQQGNEICFIVEDNGVGMDEHTINVLLSQENFNSREGTALEKGTGIGYTLIRYFVQRLSGTIDIKSKHGEGTKILVCLPDTNASSHSRV